VLWRRLAENVLATQPATVRFNTCRTDPSGQSDGSNLQFLEPMVFQATDLPEVPLDDRPTPGIDAAEGLLVDLLADGPRHFRDLLGEVNSAGLSRMTLVRAGRRLGVSKAGGVWSISGGGR